MPRRHPVPVLPFILVLTLSLTLKVSSARSAPDRSQHAQPLAQEHLVIYESNKLNNPSRPEEYVCVGSPDITQLPSGRLLASMELWLQTPNAGLEGGIDYPNHCKLLASDDQGHTWREISTTAITWGSFFQVRDKLYLIGVDPKSRNVTIVRSDDEGHIWTEPSVLAEGNYGSAAVSVAIFRDQVYCSFLGIVHGKSDSRFRREKVPAQLLLIGDATKDLIRAGSWKWSNPAFPPTAAQTAALSPTPQGNPTIPISTLEGNAFVAPGNVVTVITRTLIDPEQGPGITARFRLDNPAGGSGASVFRFESLHPFPGAQNKFKIIFDESSGLYWAAVSPIPETLFNLKSAQEAGYKGNSGNVRRMLSLAYSLDSRNWFTAGSIALTNDPLQAFHYASLTPYGDDMLILSRTSVGGAPYNNHDTNQITLHRVKNFRTLALDLRPQ